MSAKDITLIERLAMEAAFRMFIGNKEYPNFNEKVRDWRMFQYAWLKSREYYKKELDKDK